MNILKYNFARLFTLGGLVMVVAFSTLTGCASLDASDGNATTYYLIRHAEINKKAPGKPLNAKGKQRAQDLVTHMQGLRFTHIYATHTDRTRDTAAPLAKAHSMRVVQYPKPGSTIKDVAVSNSTKGKHAIKPMIKALQKVPKNSAVLVAANSGNLYAIMAGLGVSVQADCSKGANGCIPCKSKKCFPKKQFNNIWKIVHGDDGQVIMTRSTYGH